MRSARRRHPINSVHPGVINTPIWGKVRPDLAMPGNNTPIDIEDIGRRQAPLGRVGKPQDIADGVLFLSRPDASFFAGALADDACRGEGGEGGRLRLPRQVSVAPKTDRAAVAHHAGG